MRRIKLLLFCLFLNILTICICERDYAIILKKFEPLLGSEDEMCKWNDLKVAKYNRTMFTLRGTIELLKEIDETLILEVQGYEWYRVEYRLSGIQLQKTSLCQFKENDKMFFQDLSDTSDIPVKCPIPAGVYKIEDFYLDTEKFPQSFPGDKWKFIVKIYDISNNLVTGIVVMLDIDHDAGVKKKD